MRSQKKDHNTMGLKKILEKVHLKPEHYCIKVSELIFFVFSTIDIFGRYKINIVMSFCDNDDYGHAWVTRNNRNFLLKNRSVVLDDLIEIGCNDKYRYYVVNDEFWTS